MKIRNDRIINKLKKSKTPVINSNEPDNSVTITEEEWRSELGVSQSNSEIVKRVLNKSIAFVGCCFFINFFALYFFDIGLEITDFDLMFFLFSVLAIYSVGDILLQLQVKKVFESDKSLDDRMEALVTRKIFTGWQLQLIWAGIVLSILGFIFNFISLVYNDFDLDSNNFNASILCFVLASSLIGLIRIGETLTFVVFFFLSCFCYSITNWLIDEYGINKNHTTFYSFVADTVFGIEIENSTYKPDYEPELNNEEAEGAVYATPEYIPTPPEPFENFKKKQ